MLEKIRPGSPGSLAGLAEGDVLLSWRREPSPPANPHPDQGDLGSPFDLDAVLVEQLPRGRLILQGKRGAEEKSWVLVSGLPASAEHLAAAPLFKGETFALYLQGKTAVSAGDLDGGLAVWRQAMAVAEEEGRPLWALWLRIRSARELARTFRWEEADALYAQIVPPLEARGKDDALVARLLREWGLLSRERKVWAHADDCFLRALAADRKLGRDTLSAAQSLEEIGFGDNLSGGSKDFDGYLRQALEIRQRLAPGSAEIASSWLVWGKGAYLDRHFETAARRLEKALAAQKGATGSALLRLEILHELAYVQIRRNDALSAERLWKEALALAEKVAPDDFLMARISHGAGYMAGKRNHLVRAEELMRRSCDLYERIAPGHWNSADALRDLGRVSVKAGKLDAAADQLCRSMEIMEVWRRRFERMEDVRSRWAQFFAGYYQECTEALVGVGREGEAFVAAERGRARAFLNRAAERRKLPSELDAGEAERLHRLDAEHERVTEDLARVEKRGDAAGELNLLGRQREIRREKEALLVAGGPIEYPEPLSLAETVRHLDNGTVLLLYSVGEKSTLLFLVEAPSEETAGEPAWEVFTLPVGRSDLEKSIRSFRKILIDDRNARSVQLARGKALYDLLLRPAEAYVGRSRRLLVSPDGPLHVLPFAALVRDGRYLIESKPLHFTLSSTVYATLEARPAADRSRNRIAAFGDPIYPRASARPTSQLSDPFLGEVVRRGLAPLPASKEEALSIARLFPEGRAFTGEQATKEKVQEVAGSSDILHFAAHGLFNEKAPLDSALALTFSAEPGAGGSGFLRAWEVMQNLHLKADLVTLSACDSALGQEVTGEGLIGLTRAFQQAGARSVVAALWGIGDSSTADLMPWFYRELRAGKPTDEALRAAQIGMLESKKSAPFYWAAFQLYGAWD